VKIIALTGAAGSGKDTVCGFALEWCEEKGINAERLAFADPLKVSAAAAFGIDPSEALEFCNWLKQPGVFVTAERLEGSALDMPGGAKGKRISGRQFLQFYGTEAHRDVFGPRFWAEVTERKLVSRAALGLDVVFLTDPRFPNEAQMIHKHDGEIWEVVRPGQSKVEAHVSEAGLPDGAIEFQIHNSSNLDALRVLVRSVCESNLEEVA
jgi:Deoxynucleotide monophosphate kinase